MNILFALRKCLRLYCSFSSSDDLYAYEAVPACMSVCFRPFNMHVDVN